MERKNIGSSRCGSIDFWKIMITVLIWVQHSGNLGMNIGKFVLRGGYVGVEFFGIVSGFLMAASAKKKELSAEHEPIGVETFQFMKRKVRTIYPYYFVAYWINFIILHFYANAGAHLVLKNAGYSIWGLLLMKMSGVHGYYPVGPAWYISAMLMIMLTAYPLLRKMKTGFTHILAPAIVIASIGYLSLKVGHLLIVDHVVDYPTTMIRIIMDICLGCVCFVICESLKKAKLAPWTHTGLAILEAGCFMAVFVVVEFRWNTQLDFILLLLFAIGVIISFSGKSALSSVFQKPWVGKLRTWCVPVYFCHYWWGHVLSAYNTQVEWWILFLAYIVLSLLTAALCKVLAEKCLLPLWARFKRSLFIQST